MYVYCLRLSVKLIHDALEDIVPRESDILDESTRPWPLRYLIIAITTVYIVDARARVFFIILPRGNVWWLLARREGEPIRSNGCND